MTPVNEATGFNVSWLSMGFTVLRGVLGFPLVQKALDNFTQGTANQFDDMVWMAVKRVLDLKLAPDLAKAELINSFKSIQYEYDNMSPEEKWQAKRPKFVWHSDTEGKFVFNTEEV